MATYDSAGRLRWATSAGGNLSAASGSRITVDAAGDISVIGRFYGSPTFGAGETHETTLHAVAWDILAAKYDASGTLRWARQAGSTGYKEVKGMAVDGAGNYYIAGQFCHRTITFGSDDASAITLMNNDKKATDCGKRDIFVAKFRGEPLGEPHGELPVGVLANTAVTLDRPGPSAGTIWSNGTLQFRPGSVDRPSDFTGDLIAVQDITLHPGNAMTGTATAGGDVTVLPGATVAGAVEGNAPVPLVSLPAPTFTATGPDYKVSSRSTRTLVPGAYGAVSVGTGATLQLQSGDYFLRTLALER